jgi:transcriptional regulator with XRE-family HTH domain
MAADTLWRLAQEQAGVTMSSDAFKRWRERKAYTLDSAARALGLSRRMVAYYEQGEKPIPRVVALAARALEGDPGFVEKMEKGDNIVRRYRNALRTLAR